jgi:hypothetical protein
MEGLGPQHHTNFVPKSNHMAILERMEEINKNYTFYDEK